MSLLGVAEKSARARNKGTRRTPDSVFSAACVLCAACANVWGFDDLRAGDASSAEDGTAADASGVRGADAGGGDTNIRDVGVEEAATDASQDATTPDGGDDAGLDVATVDGGNDAAVCAPSATQCSGNGVQTCDSNGQWGTAVACSNSSCAMGMCSGSCSPGTVQCSGTSAAQTCVSGMWGTPTTCQNEACVGGVCSGTCSPGTMKCTSNRQVATCNTSGQWGPETTCADACLGTLNTVPGNCGGVCVPGTTMCLSDAQVETCNTSGQWGSAATCTYACVGTGVGSMCGGVCVPGTTQCTSDTQMEACSTSGTWGAATTCSDACLGTIGVVGGNCSGVCVPNATQCSGNGVQTCGSNGQWGSAVGCNGATPLCTSGVCTAAPSCAPGGLGMTNCGLSSESCCTSLEAPGGTYYRTYDLGDGGVALAADGGPTGEADPATVSGFRLDKYEVTVGRFRQFVNAWNAGYVPPAGSGKQTQLNGAQGLANSGGPGTYEPGWVTSDNSNIAPTNNNLACLPGYATWTNTVGGQENLPINCVDWSEAYAFCIWDGGFLPSEAEWEYAAAGGSQQRDFPWGSVAPGTGNQYAIYGCDYPSGAGSCTGIANVAPVGTATLGAGLWGHLDLAGNMAEWTLDWFATYVDPCTDCAYLTVATDRLLRGSYFLDGNSSNLLPSARYGAAPPVARGSSIGFRCGRTP